MMRASSNALSALVLLSLVGDATAACTALVARKDSITIAGYDYTGLVETQLDTATGFDVTGIKCAVGYRLATGSVTATVTQCGGNTGVYTVSGCLACTSGIGLCTDAAETPNAVYGDHIYFQDTGTSVRLLPFSLSPAATPVPSQPLTRMCAPDNRAPRSTGTRRTRARTRRPSSATKSR